MMSVSDLPEMDDPVEDARIGGLLAAAGSQMESTTDSVRSAWFALGAQYTAPEDYLVHAAMDRPVDAARTLFDVLQRAEKALDTYAEELVVLRRRRDAVRDEILQARALWAEADATEPGLVFDNGQREAIHAAGEAEERAKVSLTQLEQELSEAENRCATTIGALYGGDPWVLSGYGDGIGERFNGFDADTLEAGIDDGSSGLSVPRYHSEGTWFGRNMDEGAWEALKSIPETAGMLLYLDGNPGRSDGAWQGISTAASDLINLVVFADWFGEDARNQATVRGYWEGITGWWTALQNNPGGTLGAIVPDAISILIPGGAALGVARGAGKGLKAAGSGIGGALRRGADAVPQVRINLPEFSLRTPALAGVPGAPRPRGGHPLFSVESRESRGRGSTRSRTEDPVFRLNAEDRRAHAARSRAEREADIDADARRAPDTTPGTSTGDTQTPPAQAPEPTPPPLPSNATPEMKAARYDSSPAFTEVSRQLQDAQKIAEQTDDVLDLARLEALREADRFLRKAGIADLKEVWTHLNVRERGLTIEALRGGNLPVNFKTYDRFETGPQELLRVDVDGDAVSATSIKSMDTLSKTYQTPSGIKKGFKKYIESIEAFDRDVRGGFGLLHTEIDHRILEVYVPPGQLARFADLRAELESIARSSTAGPIELRLVEFP